MLSPLVLYLDTTHCTIHQQAPLNCRPNQVIGQPSMCFFLEYSHKLDYFYSIQLWTAKPSIQVLVQKHMHSIAGFFGLKVSSPLIVFILRASFIYYFFSRSIFESIIIYCPVPLYSLRDLAIDKCIRKQHTII